MKIRHYRPLFTGLLCWVLCAGVLLLTLAQGPSLRHLIGAAILAALGRWNSGSPFPRRASRRRWGLKWTSGPCLSPPGAAT